MICSTSPNTFSSSALPVFVYSSPDVDMRISSVVCESSYVATSIVVQDGHALDKADTLLMILGDSAFNPLFTLFTLLLGN